MSVADATLRMILLGEDRSASRTVKGLGSEVERTEGKLGKLHKVGHAAGLALATGLGVAATAAVAMTKRAAEDSQAQVRLATTLRHAAGATKDQVAQTEDWITAQGKLYGVTDDDLRPALGRLAVATGSVHKAQKLTSLAMNVSAGSGKSLQQVTEALVRAQNGSVGGLSRLGVATKDADGKTLSLHAITKKLADQYAGASAASAQTAAGKQKILTTQMGELQEQIGYKLLPVMSKLVSIGLRVVNWVSRNTTTVGVLVGVIGGLVAVTWAVSAATKAWFAITKLITAAQIVFTNAQWALNVAMEANPIGLVVIAIAALVVALVIAYKKSDTFRHIVQGAFHAVLGAAQSAFGWIKKNWPLLLAILTGPIGVAALVIVKNWGKIRAATAAVWSAIRTIVKGAWDGITGVVRTQIAVVLGLIRGVATGITKLGGLFLSAGKALIGKLFDGFLAAARAGGGFVSSLVSSIKDAINSTLHLPLSINFDKGPVHIHATVIPALAKGGIVTRPTMALIGEAGPEAVVPLSGRNARGFGGGDTYITVTANGLVDPQAMARKIQAELNKLGRTTRGTLATP